MLERPGGLRDVPVVLAQLLHQEGLLGFLLERLERTAPIRRRARLSPGQQALDVRTGHDLARTPESAAARPRCGARARCRARVATAAVEPHRPRTSVAGTPALAGQLLDEVCDQRRNVFAPLAERRHFDRHDVEAVEQILAEPSFADLVSRSLLVAASTRTSTWIGLAPPIRVTTPSCSTRSTLACAESDMSPISSRNSVPPSACSNFPGPVGHGAGERSLHVTEQLALDQLRGNRGAVHLDEGAFASGRGFVQRPRDQLLAGAVLTGDEHPGRRRSHLVDERRAPRCRAGLAPTIGVAALHRLAEPRVLARELRHAPSAFRTVTSRRSVSSGFSRKSKAPRWVASTAVAMVPCPEIMTIERRRVELAKPSQGLESVEPGHLHVEKDQVGAKLGVDRDRLAAGRRPCARRGPRIRAPASAPHGCRARRRQ